MELYKYEVENFLGYLDTLKTDRVQSRHKVRFKKWLAEHYDQLLSDSHDINMDYALLDEDGQPLEQDGRITFRNDPERLQELRKLYHERIVMDETPERKDMLLAIKHAVIHCGPAEFEGIAADWYDRFCEIVEDIYADDIATDHASTCTTNHVSAEQSPIDGMEKRS
ncbi:hypothetical protein [Paenibacillus sp. FSL K6-1230]|uniref:hypothetical protein n=1 Tax=Paenibacillus sp. FSL K6-1230 TaxID=2921603 RepID=UPI0003A535F1